MRDVKPKNDLIYFRGEWSSDFNSINSLIESLIEILVSKEDYNDLFLNKIIVCLKIDSESEILADKLFNLCDLNLIRELIEKSIVLNCFEAQWQLVFRVKELINKFYDSN